MKKGRALLFILGTAFALFTLLPRTLADNAPAAPTTTPTDIAGLPEHLNVDLGDGVTMEFVLIHPGSFRMGAKAWPEGSEHKVTLTKPFYLGKYLVTQEQWVRIMGSNPSHFQGAKNPVDTVNWYDCQEFLTKMSLKDSGQTFRLPTSAEWEYACRAGTTTSYSCGDDLVSLGEHAWYKANSGGTTHPVGEKKPNPWGLYDMHGNVFQWCADWYRDRYPSADETDPLGPASPTDDTPEKQISAFRLLRGGSWIADPVHLRSSRVHYEDPTYRYATYGLRCAMSVTDATAAKISPERPSDNLTVDIGGPVKMEFALIHPGLFQMGSEKSPKARPVHTVLITKPFYLGKYLVTQGQWEQVMGNNPSANGFVGSTLPVDQVSWNDCQDFMATLRRKAPGHMFRLPTEAEWEYACRAGTTTAYSFGDNATSLGEYAWSEENSGPSTNPIIPSMGVHVGASTHPVGLKKPNPWGLFDMHGNVEEWVADWYGDYSAGLQVDPTGPSIGTTRLRRGGGWDRPAGLLCSSYRSCGDHQVGAYRDREEGGLRCLLEVDPSQVKFFADEVQSALKAIKAEAAQLAKRQAAQEAEQAEARNDFLARNKVREAEAEAKPAPANTVLVVPAVAMTGEGGGKTKHSDTKLGAIGTALSGWDTEGHWIEWSFDVPADGYYNLSVCYCSELDQIKREIKVNGEVQVPFAPMIFPSTGGWANGSDDWRILTAANPVGKGSLLIKLKQGKNLIRLTDVDGRGLNVNYVAITSPDVKVTRELLASKVPRSATVNESTP